MGGILTKLLKIVRAASFVTWIVGGLSPKTISSGWAGLRERAGKIIYYLRMHPQLLHLVIMMTYYLILWLRKLYLRARRRRRRLAQTNDPEVDEEQAAQIQEALVETLRERKAILATTIVRATKITHAVVLHDIVSFLPVDCEPVALPPPAVSLLDRLQSLTPKWNPFAGLQLEDVHGGAAGGGGHGSGAMMEGKETYVNILDTLDKLEQWHEVYDILFAPHKVDQQEQIDEKSGIAAVLEDGKLAWDPSSSTRIEPVSGQNHLDHKAIQLLEEKLDHRLQTYQRPFFWSQPSLASPASSSSSSPSSSSSSLSSSSSSSSSSSMMDAETPLTIPSLEEVSPSGIFNSYNDEAIGSFEKETDATEFSTLDTLIDFFQTTDSTVSHNIEESEEPGFFSMFLGEHDNDDDVGIDDDDDPGVWNSLLDAVSTTADAMGSFHGDDDDDNGTGSFWGQ